MLAQPVMGPFSSRLDAHLAEHGPPAVFVRTHDGEWRFDDAWTRDCWERQEGVVDRAPAFVLLRDRATGFVSRLWTSGRGLLRDHPRADVLLLDDEASAEALLASLGTPPLADAGRWGALVAAAPVSPAGPPAPPR